MVHKIFIAAGVWGIALIVCNPFLESKKLRIAAVACFAVATVAFVAS